MRHSNQQQNMIKNNTLSAGTDLISLGFNSRTEQIYLALFTDTSIIYHSEIGNIRAIFGGIKINFNTSYRH